MKELMLEIILKVTLEKISKQIKELKIMQFDVFDLCALNTILGKQNHFLSCLDKLHTGAYL